MYICVYTSKHVHIHVDMYMRMLDLVNISQSPQIRGDLEVYVTGVRFYLYHEYYEKQQKSTY
jgi:hypothetical protein